MKDHLELDPVEGELVGKNPQHLSVSELEAMGVVQSPILSVVRQKCLDCCVGKPAEVRRCVFVECPLWAYRMGTNPFRAPKTEAQREAARGRLKGKPK